MSDDTRAAQPQQEDSTEWWGLWTVGDGVPCGLRGTGVLKLGLVLNGPGLCEEGLSGPSLGSSPHVL